MIGQSTTEYKQILSNMIRDAKKLKDTLLDDYDITEQHFEIGDKVYSLASGYEFPDLAEVVDIDDWRKIHGEGACVYYWIASTSLTKTELLKEKIKFYSWLYIFRFFGLWQPYINPKLGPGHAVAAGEDIFKTKEESILASYIFDLRITIYDL